jgi:hypothetical protein
MKLRDPEIFEALRDEPELLAIADAVAETQRPPARRLLLSPPARVVAIAAAAAAVALAVLLWPGGGKHGVLDRALAAIGSGRVLHVVARMPTGETLVNLETGRRITPTLLMESWADEKFERFHLLIRENGRIVGELLFPQDASKPGATVGPVDPAWAALWTGYRDALEKGTAKIERDGRVAGHAVYWIRFPAAPDAEKTEVAIDRETYRPIVFRQHVSATRTIDMRVLVVETSGFDAADFARRAPKANLLGGTSVSGGGSGRVPPVGSAQPKPLLVAGPVVAGLRLRSITPTTTFSGKRTARGVVLTYGGPSIGPSASSLTIQELRRPDDPSTWRRIPRGFVRIESGFMSTAGGRERPMWTGYLVKNGVYVTIETAVSKRAVIEAAGALHPPA